MSAAHSKLTQARLKDLLCYDSDLGAFTRRRTVGRCDRWKQGQPCGHVSKLGYTQICIDGKSYLAHRLAWLYVHGVWPSKHLDHINGHPEDNRIANLRECDDLLNMQNIRSPHRDSKSGLLGVRRLPKSGRYEARLCVDGVSKTIGTFDCAQDAHQAYLEAKRSAHSFCTI